MLFLLANDVLLILLLPPSSSNKKILYLQIINDEDRVCTGDMLHLYFVTETHKRHIILKIPRLYDTLPVLPIAGNFTFTMTKAHRRKQPSQEIHQVSIIVLTMFFGVFNAVDKPLDNALGSMNPHR
ncbi:hypothetical protein Tco_1414512 [Tanacetum coccineum]